MKERQYEVREKKNSGLLSRFLFPLGTVWGFILFVIFVIIAYIAQG